MRLLPYQALKSTEATAILLNGKCARLDKSPDSRQSAHPFMLIRIFWRRDRRNSLPENNLVTDRPYLSEVVARVPSRTVAHERTFQKVTDAEDSNDRGG